MPLTALIKFGCLCEKPERKLAVVKLINKQKKSFEIFSETITATIREKMIKPKFKPQNSTLLLSSQYNMI